MNLDCRCLGRDRDCECANQADAEDGLCFQCRYPDGGCCEGRTWPEMDAQSMRLLAATHEAMKR